MVRKSGCPLANDDEGRPEQGMGIVGFVGCLHQRQHRTAQRLGAPTDGSAMLTGDCDIRMIRGGSYSSEVRDIRSAARFFEASDAQSKRIGFRVVRRLR